MKHVQDSCGWWIAWKLKPLWLFLHTLIVAFEFNKISSIYFTFFLTCLEWASYFRPIVVLILVLIRKQSLWDNFLTHLQRCNASGETKTFSKFCTINYCTSSECKRNLNNLKLCGEWWFYLLLHVEQRWELFMELGGTQYCWILLLTVKISLLHLFKIIILTLINYSRSPG